MPKDMKSLIYPPPHSSGIAARLYTTGQDVEVNDFHGASVFQGLAKINTTLSHLSHSAFTLISSTVYGYLL